MKHGIAAALPAFIVMYGRPSGYQEAAATRAWTCILDFLAVSLLKPPSQ